MASPFLRALGGAAFALVLAAQAQAADPVVQVADGEKSCAALTQEISALEASEAKAARRAESGRKLLGLAGVALQVAAPALGAGKGSYAAQQALGAMQQQVGQQDRQQQMAQIYGARTASAAATQPPAQIPAATPERPGGKRVEHLKSLLATKAC